MNPGVDDLYVSVRQVDLPRPDATMIVLEFGYGSTPIDRLARGTYEEEGHRVEQVSDLLHQMESGQLVRIGCCAKIFLQIFTRHPK